MATLHIKHVPAPTRKYGTYIHLTDSGMQSGHKHMDSLR